MKKYALLSFIFFSVLFFTISCEKEILELDPLTETEIAPDKMHSAVFQVTATVDSSNTASARSSGYISGDDKPPRCFDPTKVSLRSCPDVYKPVCGCDGKTYQNKCSAEVAGIIRWEKGECPKTDRCIDRSNATNQDCPEIWDPVCGCNNKTYGNECEAKNAGVTKWTIGACDNHTVDPKKY